MISANMARAITDSAPNQNKWHAAFSKEIESAARRGEQSVLLCYTDCDREQYDAVLELERHGFKIVTRSEYSNGIRQHAGYYAEW